MEAATVSRRDPSGGNAATARQSFEPQAAEIADPGPLGLAAFALTTFVLSMFNAKLVGAGGEPIVFGLALAYGGLAQLLAGMWEFKTGNTFGAVAFTSYGAFWLSFWAFVQFFEKDVPKADAGHAVGLFLIAWGIFTLYMFVASLRTTAAIALVFALLTATFFLLGIGNAGAHTSIVHIGGWVGLATAAAAWYASFAAVTNSTFGRGVLPVKPLPREGRSHVRHHAHRPRARARRAAGAGALRAAGGVHGQRPDHRLVGPRGGRARPGGVVVGADQSPALVHRADRRPGRLQPAVLQVVRGRADQRLLQLPGSPRGGRQRRPRGVPLARGGGRGARDHLRLAARADPAGGQRAQGPWGRQGRRGRDLPADDPRGRRGDAGLRPHRRAAQRRLRRLQRRVGPRADGVLARQGAHHRRRRAAQGQGRRRQGRRRQRRHAGPDDVRGQAHRHRRVPDGRGRHLVARGARVRGRRVRVRGA